MSRTRKAIMATGAILLLVIAALWFVPRDTSSVSYHLKCLRSLDRSWSGPSSHLTGGAPLSLRACLYPAVWRWFLRGRPTMEQSQSEVEEHRDALVKLGYFEKRDFALTRRTLDPSGRGGFSSLVANAPFTDNHWVWTTVGDRPFVITVTALRADMPVWSNLVSRFDSSDAELPSGKISVWKPQAHSP